MNVAALDTSTDYYAKTNSSQFPVAEKLVYYNEAYGILYGLIIDESEDSYEVEKTKTTVDGQADYLEPSRIHHINWLKIKYGADADFVPARYKPEADLVLEYGNQLEDTLAAWSESDPIYFYKGSSFFVYPTPATGDGGADYLKVSVELLPTDLTTGEPSLPANFHYLLAVYAAWKWLSIQGEDNAAATRKNEWNEGVKLMLETMFPRARQAEIVAHVPDDDGSDL